MKQSHIHMMIRMSIAAIRSLHAAVPVCVVLAVLSCRPADVRMESEDVPVPEPVHSSMVSGDSVAKQVGERFEDPLVLSAGDAVFMALRNNPEIEMKRIDIRIREAAETAAVSEYDPLLQASLSHSRERAEQSGSDYTSERTAGSVSVEKSFPSGTDIGVQLETGISDSGLNPDTSASARIGVSVTQALLEGRGRSVNYASICQAAVDRDISVYELRRYGEYLVSEVEKRYWQYVLAVDSIRIYEQSLELAKKQRNETGQRIDAGTIAATEKAAAEAEVALRKEDLINARSSLEVARLRLLRLLGPRADKQWAAELKAADIPALPDPDLGGVDEHVAIALAFRPDLNKARLGVRRGELDVVQTRNGLLPRMDLFINIGKTGYSDSFSRAFGNFDEKHYDAEAGLTFSYNFGNRYAGSQDKRARFSLRNARLAVENLADLVRFDVRSAYVEVTRAREQVAATAATSRMQNEKLRAETEKFKADKSTSLLVAQAQRDAVKSRISEKEALVNYLNALIDFYVAEGTLLERRGVLVEPTSFRK